MNYRTKPGEVDATMVDEILLCARGAWAQLPPWLVKMYDAGGVVFSHDYVSFQGGSRGRIVANAGDWIVRDAAGNLTVLSPEIFDATYEMVIEAPPA